MRKMRNENLFTVRHASWAEDAEHLRRVRHAVFVLEHGIPEALEWDSQDSISQHWLAEHKDGQALGTARLLDSGQIGRMAVLPEWRGIGIGRALLGAVIGTAAHRGFTTVFLHAQLSAETFYLACDFQPDGDVFEEAGIPHRTLRMTVQ